MGVTSFILLSLGLTIAVQAQNCTKPEGGPNMSLTGDDILKDTFANGTTVRFACDTGYKPAGGSSSTTCINGDWSPRVTLRCDIKSCGSAGEVANGQIDYPDGNDFGHKAYVTCDPGYILVGNPTLNCGDKGWEGRLPVCEVVTCGPPETIDNGSYEPVLDVYEYLGVATYSCANGYTLNGSREIHCTDSGRFSPAPNCVRVECEDVDVPNGEVQLGGSRPPHGYLSSLTFRCNIGYEMSGSPSITCDINSNWIPGIPKCNRIPTTTTSSPGTTKPPGSGSNSGLKIGLGVAAAIAILLIVCCLSYRFGVPSCIWQKKGRRRGDTDKAAAKDGEDLALA
ncbi:membrane cofactor protein-like isoform 3-T3 [Menidia menidia]